MKCQEPFRADGIDCPRECVLVAVFSNPHELRVSLVPGESEVADRFRGDLQAAIQNRNAFLVIEVQVRIGNLDGAFFHADRVIDGIDVGVDFRGGLGRVGFIAVSDPGTECRGNRERL